MPYRLIANTLLLIVLGEILRIYIGLRIRDCILMFEVYVFQILYLLTECLTHCLVVFVTDIDRPEPSTTPRR